MTRVGAQHSRQCPADSVPSQFGASRVFTAYSNTGRSPRAIRPTVCSTAPLHYFDSIHNWTLSREKRRKRGRTPLPAGPNRSPTSGGVATTSIEEEGALRNRASSHSVVRRGSARSDPPTRFPGTPPAKEPPVLKRVFAQRTRSWRLCQSGSCGESARAIRCSIDHHRSAGLYRRDLVQWHRRGGCRTRA